MHGGYDGGGHFGDGGGHGHCGDGGCDIGNVHSSGHPGGDAGNHVSHDFSWDSSYYGYAGDYRHGSSTLSQMGHSPSRPANSNKTLRFGVATGAVIIGATMVFEGWNKIRTLNTQTALSTAENNRKWAAVIELVTGAGLVGAGLYTGRSV